MLPLAFGVRGPGFKTRGGQTDFFFRNGFKICWEIYVGIISFKIEMIMPKRSSDIVKFVYIYLKFTSRARGALTVACE